VVDHSDVWVATAREVAEHADELLPRDGEGRRGRGWPSRLE